MKVGVILIGDELLSGLREDKHMPQVLALIKARGLSLAWVRTVGDEWELLVQTLRETLQTREIVFSFGGIGATPDDLTRQAAAAAAGVRLVRHPQAVALIESCFGEQAYPQRIRMGELPDGSTLIPNVVNRMPGFRLYHHHFVPGFPSMAWPMVAWVLDTHYPQYHNARPPIELRWLLHDVRESDLIPFMEELLHTFPGVRLSSLPSTTVARQIDFGLKGQESAVQQAARWWQEQMTMQQIVCDPL